MPVLTLYTDLSANFPHAFATIMACATDLATRNCFVPPPPPWGVGKMHSHQPLWGMTDNPERQEGKFPPFWQDWFNQVLQAARHGSDILFFGRESNPSRWEKFFNILRAYEELDSYRICSVAVIGRPICQLEQQARLLWPGEIPPARWFALAREYAHIENLTQLWRSELGAENSFLFGDTATATETRGLSAGHIAAFEQIGIQLPANPVPVTHLLSLASREARHFVLATEVQGNSWPRLDMPQFTDFLKKYENDEGWDCSPISLPRHRAALERNTGNSLLRLEETLNLMPGALGCPENLSAEGPWQPYAKLSDKVIDFFCAELPSELKKPLLQRYVQDSRILGNGQKRIYQHLSASAVQDDSTQISAQDQALVTVLTLSRNQESFIARCIDSVLAQKTEFPIRHIILDHCSTDNTPDIICKYAGNNPSIHPVLLSRWVKGQNIKGLFSRCHSKYVALCDADDYFTDPLKLQKQVEFLEAHPECALCFHPVDVIYADGSPPRVYPANKFSPGDSFRYFTIEDLLNSNFIQTNSVMYRWRFADGLPQWFDTTLVPGDWYWHLLHAETGRIAGLPDRMSVYYRHSASLYASAEGEHADHRSIHGLDELRTYQALNSHFKGRYYDELCKLATSVLVDFVRIYQKTENDSFLVKAAEICPEFTRDFLTHIQHL